jgi:two-component system, chemotaxis family, chemotaxis protein CheY
VPRTIKALVVDDCPVSRKVIIKALSGTGLATFEFTEAADGVEALDKYDPEATDIVFVDINMPRMDGIEFLRRLRSSQGYCPPAVLITAESDGELLAAAMNDSRADAILRKPVDIQRLQKGLKTIIGRLPDRAAGWTIPHGDCAAQAMQEMLTKVCHLTVVPEARKAQAPAAPFAGAGAAESRNVVFGVMAVSGELQWSVTLGFEQSAAEGVATRFAGCPVSFDDPDLGDAIGEISNVVVGYLKRLLSARGVQVAHSLPTVFSADRIRMLVQRGRSGSADRVDFNSEVGRFWISVTEGSNGGIFL